MTIVRCNAALRPIDRLFGEGALAGLPDARLLERYVLHRDELAFEALVRQHGSMVLGVCRRVLEDPNDAEDAFQAAFLLLARKARSIRAEGSVGGWLHRVAWRIALQVHSDAASRRVQERRAAERTEEAIAPDAWHDDTAAVIHQEIDRLPEHYRRPIILCYLEDMTYPQAARHLHWSEATTRGRLARARDLLRTRLTRRGVTLAGIVWPGMAATVPSALRNAVARTARQLALGESAAVSTTTIALMKQAARGMMIAQFQAVAVATLLVAALTGLATALAGAGIGDDPRIPAGSRQVMKDGPAPAVTAAPSQAGKGEMTSIHGRVLAPDGKLAEGADVFVVVNLPRPLTMSAETSRVVGPARTDADGRFRLDLPRRLVDGCCNVDAVAYRPGFAAGLLQAPDDRREATIRLEPEEPVRIRLLDLEGRPASRARLRVVNLWKTGPTFSGLYIMSAPDRPLPGWLGFLSADDQGQLIIPGLTRDTELTLEVVDERFAVQQLRLREGRAIVSVNEATTPTFTLTPAHRLEGRVRLGESGPVAAGAKFVVISHMKPEDVPQSIRIGGRADAEGRFSVNVPRSESHEVLVYPPEGSPFAFRRVVTAGTQGVRQEVDVAVPRGVLVKGKVVESPSGRAVAGAILEYRPRQANNPNFHKEAIAEREGYEPTAVTGLDGSFRLGVMPGPGHLLVKAPTPEYIIVETSQGEIEAGTPYGPRVYTDGLLTVDAPAEAEVDATITLRRGDSVRGRVVDPDGRPAVDVRFFTRFDMTPIPADDGRFELKGLDPDKPTTVFFLDADHQLARIMEFSGRDFDRPVTVRLERCGAARARFIDGQGRPFGNLRIETSNQPMIHLEMIVADRSPGPNDAGSKLELEKTLYVNLDYKHYDPLTTDPEGRVTHPSLIPGATYRIIVGEKSWVTKKQFVAEAGRTLELGEITVNP